MLVDINLTIGLYAVSDGQGIMDELIINICRATFHDEPAKIKRCSVGLANYVFIVEIKESKYTVRLSTEKNAYNDTVRLLGKLTEIGIPVPRVLYCGSFEQYDYVVLSYIEGEELWAVYKQLTKEDKKILAKEIVHIQREVSLRLSEHAEDWTWLDFVHEILDRAKVLIDENGFFETEKVIRVESQIPILQMYFEKVEPMPYLDDVTTKNLLVKDGHISGIIDVDWIGMGDVLTFAALTYVALLNMGYDTDYVSFILDEMDADDIQRKVFLFYSLMYCVDFMGERGTKYKDKVVEVNSQIIDRLDDIYDRLWNEWRSL